MSAPINKITIEGFKSIRQLHDFELRALNLLIGANGAGKSNFIQFFQFLHEMVHQRMELSVNVKGGADAYLYLGPSITERIIGKLEFGRNGYEFHLIPTINNRFVFQDERIRFFGSSTAPYPVNRTIGRGHAESKLQEQLNHSNNKAIAKFIWQAISNWTVYHFHDTSDSAGVKRWSTVRDYERLRPDASNLPAFLLWLVNKHPATYALIRDTVQLVAPFFSDFKLRPQLRGQDEMIQLEWTQTGSDYPFHPSQLSDGTLRFICLATALLQPTPPATIVIDEPELGLHPYALALLAGLIQQAAHQTQVIVSTQSAALLNYFEPEDIVVVDRVAGESRFRRLSFEELEIWLAEDYTLGELWQKNVYGGGPAHE